MTTPYEQLEPGLKVAAQMSPEATEDDFAFARQMGVGHAVAWTDASKASPDYYRQTRDRYGNAGITLYGLGNGDVHNQQDIVLGLSGRDEKIEEYKRHLRALGTAGIPYTTYAHMGNGIWSTEREATRGGASARGFDLDKATQNQLNRGRRLVEILKQPQYQPLSVEKQVLILFAGANGYLDGIKETEVGTYEQKLYEFFEVRHAALIQTLSEQKKMDDELKAAITQAVEEFTAQFVEARKGAVA